jgi:hypothetical protein
MKYYPHFWHAKTWNSEIPFMKSTEKVGEEIFNKANYSQVPIVFR